MRVVGIMYVMPPLKCMMANYVHLLLDSCKKMGTLCIWNCRGEDCVLWYVRFANGGFMERCICIYTYISTYFECVDYWLFPFLFYLRKALSNFPNTLQTHYSTTIPQKKTKPLAIRLKWQSTSPLIVISRDNTLSLFLSTNDLR